MVKKDSVTSINSNVKQSVDKYVKGPNALFSSTKSFVDQACRDLLDKLE